MRILAIAALIIAISPAVYGRDDVAQAKCQGATKLKGSSKPWEMSPDIGAISWQPGRNAFAILQAGRVVLLSASSIRSLGEFPTNQYYGTGLAWDRLGRFLAAEDAYNVYVWDIDKCKLIDRFAFKEALTGDVCWIRDGTTLAVVAMGGVHILNIKTHNEQAFFRTLDLQREGDPFDAPHGYFSPTKHVMVTFDGNSTIAFWRLGSDKPFAKLYHSEMPEAYLSPNGERLAVVKPRTLDIYNPRNARVIKSLANNSDLFSTSDWSPDSKVIAVATNNLDSKGNPVATNHGIILWRINSDEKSFLPARDIYKLKWSPDNTHLAGISGNNDLCLWNTRTRKQYFSLKLPANPTNTLCWNSSGSLVAVGTVQGDVYICTRGGKVLRVIHADKLP